MVTLLNRYLSCLIIGTRYNNIVNNQAVVGRKSTSACASLDFFEIIPFTYHKVHLLCCLHFKCASQLKNLILKH